MIASGVVAYTFRWSVVSESIGEFGRGLLVTLELSALSLVLSLALGLVVALARLSPLAPLRLVAYGYVQIFRALSLYIYVLWIYFGLASAVGVNLSPLAAGVVALTALNSAYMAEIYRSALAAVDPGQREAALSLGFGRVRAFTTVTLPQAVRIAVPGLVNQFIDIVKDSSIIAIIGTLDLMGVANQLVSYYRAPFELYTLVAAFYLALVLSISAAATMLERRLQRHLA
ncbi:MAG TPA: amino acid ABC transporter permease [Gaiellaceae bacterium]|nr:amino acid ABC transporter permease [Gaiellaceae bacterium]